MFIKSRNSRPGFTLVEIIVVITILSVLFAMAAGAVFRAKATADKAKVSTEIQQLAASVGTFKSKYGVDFLPSKFVLRNTVSQYTAAEKSSKDFLMKMFPRIDQAANHTWAGSNPTDVVTLNGSECLVFFLGGRNGTEGFASNPSMPWPAAGTRGAASFEFDIARLKPSPFQASNTANILVYVDAFASGQNDQPYYYFTSYKRGNDYATADALQNGPTVWPPSSGVQGDLGAVRIAPFCDASGRFYNPTSFQIISAGRDKRIGNFTPPGGSTPFFVIWNNGDFTTTSVPGNEATDNLCNFFGNELGTPQ